MTNWEKYKDKILKITTTGFGFSIVKEEPEVCATTDCDVCLFHNRPANTSCQRARLEWLDKEYKEYEEYESCETCRYFHRAEGFEVTGLCGFSLKATTVADTCETHDKK